MRRSTPDKADPAFLDEKTARKQAERQVLLDALSSGLEAEAIEWTAGTTIPPELLASLRIQLRQWRDSDLKPFAAFAGFTGLNIPDPELPFGPCVEVGWRLAPQFWGLGLATETARLALWAGFESVGLEEILAITTLRSTRSQAVMKRLGMQESIADEFDHYAFPADSSERRCCVYRLSRARWAALNEQAKLLHNPL